MRSKSEIAIWCIFGAVIAWLLAALVYLYGFHWEPPPRYRIYHDEVWLPLLIGLSGAPLGGLYAARRDRGLFTYIVIGALVGTVIGLYLWPMTSMSRWGRILALMADPLYDYHHLTTVVVYFEQLGSVIAVALKQVGSPGARYQFSIRAILIVMTEWAMFLATVRCCCT